MPFSLSEMQNDVQMETLVKLSISVMGLMHRNYESEIPGSDAQQQSPSFLFDKMCISVSSTFLNK